jgi:hypothetical protein
MAKGITIGVFVIMWLVAIVLLQTIFDGLHPGTWIMLIIVGIIGAAYFVWRIAPELDKLLKGDKS